MLSLICKTIMTFVARHIGRLGSRHKLRERDGLGGRGVRKQVKERGEGKHCTKEKPGLSHEWQAT